jgi:hypothetical protein
MSVIKTLSELSKEHINNCSDELASKYLKSVRAIYGSTKSGKPDHIGTCVAIIYRGEKYLITAAHVIDHNKNTELYVSGEFETILITGTASITGAPDGVRKDDIIDLAIIHIDSDMLKKMGKLHYITEGEMELRDISGMYQCCLALGYPNSKNKYKVHRGASLKESPFVYTAYLEHGVEVYSKTKTNPNHHYLLGYSDKHLLNENEEIVNSLSTKGVSGGGLFLIEGATDPVSYKPNTPCSGKLIGILIEYRKYEKVLIYTKMSLVIKTLARQFTQKEKK